MERKQLYMILVIAITLVGVCLSGKPEPCLPSEACLNGKRPKCRIDECKNDEVNEGFCSQMQCCASPASDDGCKCGPDSPIPSACVKCCEPEDEDN